MGVDPANVLTLSCKSRPPCGPSGSGAAAAATNTKLQERTAADVTRACSSEPPEGGSAAEPRLGGFCQLVRAVSRFFSRRDAQKRLSHPNVTRVFRRADTNSVHYQQENCGTRVSKKSCRTAERRMTAICSRTRLIACMLESAGVRRQTQMGLPQRWAA